MINYNTEYLSIKSVLIDFLLTDLSCEILEISYDVRQAEILISVVSLQHVDLVVPVREIKMSLGKDVKTLHRLYPKESFVDGHDAWQLPGLERLPNLLFSRAELC